MKSADGISFNNSNNWLIKELNKPRSKRLIRSYVSMIMSGKKPDYDLLGKIYRQDELIPAATVKRLFRYKETQEMINKELETSLTSNNVTLDYLISKRKEIIDLSKDKDKLGIMLKAVEGFEDMYNMRSTKKETNLISEQVNYTQLLENGVKNELSAKRETPLDVYKSELEQENSAIDNDSLDD